MSRQEKTKWKYIIVLDEQKKPMKRYELDDTGNLKHKFKRQPKRTDAEMMEIFNEKRKKYILPILTTQNFIMSDLSDNKEEEEEEIPFPILVKD